MDDGDMVMYVSAYTKLLGCGLRLGFGVVPEPVRKGLARLRFGGAPSHMASMAVHEYMKQDGDRHIQAVAESLKAKRGAMLGALTEHFPPTCWSSRPHGGMMVWVRLPEGADTWNALEKAVERGVKYNPGPVFRAQRDCRNYLRLTYSHNTPDEIREGVALLSEVFRKEGLFG
jgi:DNA-binding transcriptional MocR family regulator